MSAYSNEAGVSLNELVAFRLGDQEFCIDIQTVSEIRGWTPATPLPQAPDFVPGVINLRGAVLPVIDLSRFLGFGPTEPTARHVIMVARVGNEAVGLLVDGVSEILAIKNEEVQATPAVVADSGARFVKGLITVEGRMIGIISLADMTAATLH